MTSKPAQKSQQSQTDFSTLSLLEKLKQKDQEIEKLQRELANYRHRNLSLNQDISKILNQTPRSLRPSNPDTTFQVLQGKLFTSQEPIRPKSIPLDTANIEEFSCLSRGLSKAERPSKHQKKLSNDKSIKNPYIQNSKLSLKAKQRLNKNPSIISDLVYQDVQDVETWSNLLSKFREDPKLIKQALDLSQDRSRNSGSAEPVQIRTRVGSSYKSRKASQDMPEVRPISANKPNFRPVTTKFQEIDWSKSVLDSLVARGKADFNTDKFYSNSQVEEMMLNKSLNNLEEVYEKIMKTQEKLKSELMLPKSYMIVPVKGEDGVYKMLQNCLDLFRARALVVRILRLVHKREDVMLRLVASEEEGVEKDFEALEKMGQEILQMIAFLKHAKFPVSSFVYLGEDYAVKVQKDVESILALYPKFKKEDIFAEFSL